MDKKYHFVLIDDDDVFNFLSERVLNNSGQANSITVFSKATDALNYFAENNQAEKTDILLLDIRMPGMSGFDFLEEFQKYNFQSVHVHMLTSSLDDRDKLIANSYSLVKGFYSKPLTKGIIAEICELKG